MLDTVTSTGSALLGGAWPVVWTLIKIVALIIPLMLCVAYLTLWERKAIGWSQIRPGPNRVGPLGLLQPIADAVKLIFKEIIVPTAANKPLFFLGPVMTIMPALAAWAVVPFGPEVALANINAGLLFLMAITSMEVYGVTRNFQRPIYWPAVTPAKASLKEEYAIQRAASTICIANLQGHWHR